jgi:hypothetical protein
VTGYISPVRRDRDRRAENSYLGSNADVFFVRRVLDLLTQNEQQAAAAAQPGRPGAAGCTRAW